MIKTDAAAVHRAAGLLRAFRDDDPSHWATVLAADYATDSRGPYTTFCAMTVLADRLVDSIAALTGDDPETVLKHHTDAIAQVALDE